MSKSVATGMCSVFFRVCSVVIVVLAMQLPGESYGAGLLRVHPSNPRYLTDDSGKAIYLGGHQIFVDLQDNTFNKYNTYNYQSQLDWSSYLQFAKERQLNYVRNWTLTSTGCGVPFECAVASPMPYRRVDGQGTANDGWPKFDLNQFDEEFFNRLRSRIIEAGNNGIYVSVMLYDVYSFSNFSPPLDPLWGGNVFNGANNINGIDADANGDGWGVEFFTAPSAEISALQKSYVMKVIDTVSDLDNVIFEIGNEVGALQWQYEMLDFVKYYETSKPKQHLVLLSPGGLSGAQTYTHAAKGEIVGSSADLYSASINWADYLNNPPVNNNGKPGILDRDHVDPGSGPVPNLPWKAFAQGYHYNLYDHPFESGADDHSWDLARYNIGAVVNYANNVFADLSSMVPSGELSSTGFALANPGVEYLIVQPGSGAFNVQIAAGNYYYEWFDPSTASTVETGTIDLQEGNNTFTPPLTDSAVLYLKNAGVIQTAGNSSAQPSTSGATLAGSLAPVSPGSALTVTWSGTAAPTAEDWIGLFAPGAGNRSFIDWTYVSCSKTATSASAAGSCEFTVPAHVSPGTYELRLLADDGFDALATGVNLTVQ